MANTFPAFLLADMERFRLSCTFVWRLLLQELGFWLQRLLVSTELAVLVSVVWSLSRWTLTIWVCLDSFEKLAFAYAVDHVSICNRGPESDPKVWYHCVMRTHMTVGFFRLAFMYLQSLFLVCMTYRYRFLLASCSYHVCLYALYALFGPTREHLALRLRYRQFSQVVTNLWFGSIIVTHIELIIVLYHWKCVDQCDQHIVYFKV